MEPYNPMGLQVWDSDLSFNRALDGGRLVLVIITASWCDRGGDVETVETLASRAAERIDDMFLRNSGGGKESAFDSTLLSLAKPLVGIMPRESATHFMMDGLGSITHYPALKFVSTPQNCLANNNHNEDDDATVWDFIGPRETVDDIYDSVMMYWYRTVFSTHISRCESNRPKPSESKMASDNKQLNPSPIFKFTSQIELASFLETHGERILRPSQARHRSRHLLEKELFEFYTGLQSNNSSIGGIFYPQPMKEEKDRAHGENIYSQDIDPYILFVQCRLSGKKSAKEQQSKAKSIFDELAAEMIHRRDVAFFTFEVLKSKSCYGWFPSGIMSNGGIAVIRVKRVIYYSYSPSVTEKIGSTDQSFWNQRPKRVIHNITTDWMGIHPHDLFVPTAYSTDEDMFLNSLTKFVVIHTTPTVMWFDKSRIAQLAFPAYRKLHAVLFIDMALGHERSELPVSTEQNLIGWPESLSYSLETERLLLDQQRAVQMFYNAAFQYRSKHKDDDVVFLIMPSSETRMLTTFGVDFWTPQDEALFGIVEESKRSSNEDIDNFTCQGESSSVMPMMAVTDSSDRAGKQTSRYYLCHDDIFAPSDILFENGGSIKSYIDKILSGTAVQFSRSERRQVNDDDISTTSNVTVVTGSTFHSLVMEREKEHTMLLIKSSFCGHCKRFSIFWNEFQSIVQALNWSSVINVCKIDVSKNDVPHPQIDAWDLPSVYYFPPGSKENPVEMTPQYDINSMNAQYEYDEGLSWVTSGYDVVEWMMRQGKLDWELLVSLDADTTDSIDEV
jgi:hypothetical protein